MSYTITADPIQQNTTGIRHFFLDEKRRDSGGEWTRGKCGEHAPALSFPKGKTAESVGGRRVRRIPECGGKRRRRVSLVVISQADGSERRRLTSWV